MRKVRFSRSSFDQQLKTLYKEAEERDTKRRAKREGLPYFDYETTIDKDALSLVSKEKARHAKVAVVEKKGQAILVVAKSPKNPGTQEIVDSLKKEGYRPSIMVASETTISTILGQYPDTDDSDRDGVMSEALLQEDEKRINRLSDIPKELAKRKETSDILEFILMSALSLRASDIHIEHLTKEESQLRLRIDGILKDTARMKGDKIKRIVGRIKLLSKLKLNVAESPQDGRFTIKSKYGDVEVRTSIIPAEFGEAVVMRLLDPRTVGMELDNLGFREDDKKTLLKALKQPNGMVLVTGPTGSGKTTTLYTLLKKAVDPSVKIVTIEDPIEYHLGGVEQTQVSLEDGYTFASGLRSILRQDPDIILVGEIRDRETAKTSINAALTGHLVFSTLHTNNASGAIPRLIDLGIKAEAIGPALTLVVAQRLVRRLCEKCRISVKPEKDLKDKIERFIKSLPKDISHESIETKLYKPGSCSNCVDGFRGRIEIAELLKIGDEVDKLIRKSVSENDIEKYATEKQGMLLMQEDGLLKAIQGVTTIEEVERVTGPIDW